jgi:hypothetical protein
MKILVEPAGTMPSVDFKPGTLNRGQTGHSPFSSLRSKDETVLRNVRMARAVPSALRGLTSVFGMGTGESPAVRSPTT